MKSKFLEEKLAIIPLYAHLMAGGEKDHPSTLNFILKVFFLLNITSLLDITEGQAETTVIK